MKKTVTLITIIVALLAVAAIFIFQKYSTSPSPIIYSNTPAPTSHVTINGHSFSVEIADTDAKRTQGLSGHPPLAPDAGMIFIFDSLGYYPFWMKDMLFPLDFVWINGNRIVSLNQNIPAPSGKDIPIITPTSAVDKVLEINAGTIQKDNIQIGDQVYVSL